MRFLMFLTAFLIASFIGIHTVLQNGSFLKFLDAHPHPVIVPTTELILAEGYYLFNDFQNSATCYIRVAERYPKSRQADDAYFGYLQALDDMNKPRAAMAEAYGTYLTRFPEGRHTKMVEKRIEMCRNR